VGAKALSVIDRYTDKVTATIDLPGEASDLRMDGLGRYVIARPVRGDSAWVIAVANNHLVGTAHTRWADDLPAAAPDGAIATLAGKDVIFLDGETLQPVRTVAGGAADYWYFTFWNGFRPRAAGVDQPVSFATADSQRDSVRAASDSAHAASDSMISAQTPATPNHPAPTQPTPAPSASTPAAAASQFTVQFAAMLTPEKAHALADSISVEGTAARVVPSQRAGTTIYRVVLGPYPNRATAERIGHEANRSYWVFAGAP
jgi:cell division septation protein DedD